MKFYCSLRLYLILFYERILSVLVFKVTDEEAADTDEEAADKL